MKYLIMSPGKLNKDLTQIVDVLNSKYNIEQIYLNVYESGNSPYELIILVANKYVKTLGDLVHRIVTTIRESPKYKVLCYVAFQTRDKIREGNLFLFTSCQQNKLIFNIFLHLSNNIPHRLASLTNKTIYYLKQTA